MARTPITPTALGATGVIPADVATAVNFTDGNSFVWRKGRQVYVANADDTTLTVTIPTPGTVGAQGLAIADGTFTVAAGKGRLLPSLGPEYRQPDGNVHLNYSGADSAVTAAVLDMA
ncbi:hypothetical protein [Streptosporangium sp. NPDC051022]|uniref:hypothetical protein n=1 Tax=Streptosporangium sp. NPDC051022 TaxID=3155752 RepID=UPI00341E5BD2